MSPTAFEHDVFLSYSSTDRTRVQRLAERLRDAGVRVWFDEAAIRPGDDIYLHIEHGLESSRVLVLCMSPAAFASDWVRLERGTTLFRDPLNRARRFVPLLLEDCTVPDTLRRYRCIDYREEATEAFAELVAACAPEGAEAPVPPAPAPAADVAPLAVTRPGVLRQELDRLFPAAYHWLTYGGTEPRELVDLREYLRELRARIRGDLWEKTYLPLEGEPLAPGPLAAGGAPRDPFVTPIHQVILQIIGRAEGGDSATAQIAAASRRSRVVRNVLRLLERTDEPLVLLGEPGSGKTMTLQQAALAMAERERRRVFPHVPLYVRLGEFHVARGPVRIADVWRYVKREAPPVLLPWIDSLAYDGRLVILFDGMDEMSRERYGEHTEALSQFADWTQARTLFSCRITDFSPKFIHQRLVVLPFSGDQVGAYLRRTLPRPRVVIDGREWSLRQLARRINRRDLPVEANNPFVLSLLCLYLLDKGTWPASRVDLLGYYNKKNYERKLKEADDEPPLPPLDEAFDAWARFAYAVTERNRGPAIPLDLLEAAHDPSRLRAMVRAGKRCGVLKESRDGEEHLVRFEHHRFQEYFTALHIHLHHPPLDWLARLDAPRWQETMLNLLLLGNEDETVHPLAAAIVEQTRLCREAVERVRTEREAAEREKKAKEAAEKAARGGAAQAGPAGAEEKPADEPEEEIPLPDEHEAVLADRVELSSRIMHQAAGAARVQEVLMEPFRGAVDLLANHGSPITQVKMMRACHNVPGIDLIEALKKPLNSRVRWVRDQALLLIAASPTGARALGSDLPTEIGYDVANGLALTRLSVYWNAARSGAGRGAWWGMLAGAVCQAAGIVALLAVAALAYRGAWLIGDDWVAGTVQLERQMTEFTFEVLGAPASVAGFVLLVVAALLLALWRNPSLYWLAILGGASGVIVLIPALTTLWSGSWEGAVMILILLALCVPASFGSVLLGLASHGIALAAYLVLTSGVRRKGHRWRTFYAAALRNCHFDVGLGAIAASAGALVFTGVVIGILYAIGWVFARVLRVEWNPLAISLVLVYLALGAVFAVIWFRSEAGEHGRAATLRTVRRFVLLVLAWVAGLATAAVGAAFAIRALGKQLNPLLGLSWSPWITGAAAGAVLAACAVGVRLWMRRGWRASLLWMGGVAAVVALVVLGFAFNHLWPRITGAIARGVAAVLWLTLVFVLYRMLAPLRGRLSRLRFLGRLWGWRGSWSVQEWRRSLEAGNPRTQEYLLYVGTPESLRVTTTEYLHLLKEVQPVIKDEPAASTYWETRNEVEEILRQERRG